jgi:hypothetical protein
MWRIVRIIVFILVFWIAYSIPQKYLWHPTVTNLVIAIVLVFTVSIVGSILHGSLSLFFSRNRSLVIPHLSVPAFSGDSPLQSIYFTSLIAVAFGFGRLFYSLGRSPDPIGLIVVTFGLGTFSGYLLVSRILYRRVLKLK